MRIFQRSPPVCIRGSPYAYGDPHMHNYTYGDTKLNFPYAHHFIMRMGIPICDFFSDPCPFAYKDPHMHTAIPVCKITHMGIQDLISRMEIFPICIRLVTEKSPYAYRDAQIPVCIRGLVSIRSPYAYRDCANPRMHTGIKINPRMHTGITS